MSVAQLVRSHLDEKRRRDVNTHKYARIVRSCQQVGAPVAIVVAAFFATDLEKSKLVDYWLAAIVAIAGISTETWLRTSDERLACISTTLGILDATQGTPAYDAHVETLARGIFDGALK